MDDEFIADQAAEIAALKEALRLLLMFDLIGDSRPVKRLGQTARSVAKERYDKLMADRSNSAPNSRQMIRDLIMGFTDTPWLPRFRAIVEGQTWEQVNALKGSDRNAARNALGNPETREGDFNPSEREQ